MVLITSREVPSAAVSGFSVFGSERSAITMRPPAWAALSRNAKEFFGRFRWVLHTFVKDAAGRRCRLQTKIATNAKSRAQTTVISILADSRQTPLRASSIFAVPLLCCNKLASTRYPKKERHHCQRRQVHPPIRDQHIVVLQARTACFPNWAPGSGTPNPKK